MTGWKETCNLDEDTELVKSYVPEDVKETWKDEAEEQGFSSLSKYVAAKVEQARAHEQIPRNSESSEQDQQLQNRITELEEELEEARAKQGGGEATVSVLDDGVVKQALSYQCKTLEEVLRDLIEDSAADQLIRQPVETRLYELAADQEVEFQRGAGWRLAQAGGEKR
jgi:hypothetical protein